MLNILLSHWATYLYVIYVLVLLVLFIAYRDKPAIIYRKIRQLRPHRRMLAHDWRVHSPR